jgi:hypothetical protein
VVCRHDFGARAKPFTPIQQTDINRQYFELAFSQFTLCAQFKEDSSCLVPAKKTMIKLMVKESDKDGFISQASPQKSLSATAYCVKQLA